METVLWGVLYAYLTIAVVTAVWLLWEAHRAPIMSDLDDGPLFVTNDTSECYKKLHLESGV
jgi:hypothetical protein